MNYLVFGVLTTAVNFLVYLPLNQVISYLIANVISWIFAVVFAFLVNKAFVFESDGWDRKTVLPQLTAFITARLLSLALEELTLLITVEVLLFDSNVMKVFAQILVVVVNYFASKFVIFRGDK
ncbi:MAG: GtrA family protein [Eubacteriales bacterium]|nr:GtrA family protein [Eubacteriales bacterium]